MSIKPAIIHKKTSLTESGSPNSWGALQVFCLYRYFVIIGLVFAFVSNMELFPIGRQVPFLFMWVIGSYMLIGIINMIIAILRYPSFRVQVVTEMLIDMIALTLLIYSSHNVLAPMGVLINVVIAAGSILMVGRLSIFFAAIASLLVLFEHAYSLLMFENITANYIQVGLLGVTFFATAMLAYSLSGQIHRSEELAKERGRNLAKLEQMNEYIVQQIQSAILVVDENNFIQLMNDAAERLLAVNVIQRSIDLREVSAILLEHLIHWRKQQEIKSSELRLRSEGPMLHINFVPLGKKELINTVIFLDDTSKIAQQAQQMKLASLGRLTASIAHEIRNPLSAISYAAQLLEESSGLNEEDVRLAGIISQQTLRMNEVVKNVLQLSRRKDTVFKKLSLQSWLEKFINELAAHLSEPPTINIDVLDNINVYFDPTQLQQILTNLCENGLRYSKEHTGKPTLFLRGGIEDASKRVFLEVIDQGKGINPKAAQHIFEPFFTTEPYGTGLGLYLARELCEANRAELSFTQSENHGGCFRITFQKDVLVN